MVNNGIGCFGSHVADAYTITYKAVDGTELNKTEKDDGTSDAVPLSETTVTNLASNSAYTITIQIEGHGATDPTTYDIHSDISQPETGITSQFDVYFVILKQ